ncbi:MAG: fumarylacetoacetate hydrolase family protein [SAR202 cluster bacterium]|mgnify:CR=1 FL=1|nr:fumarylacetoacetate hydrolase family protein [SAR202 cluster bacterium]|tara:strand:+ start:197 stop:1093 length:897 start_codon:yes stop_codon:yes gene_type:complete
MRLLSFGENRIGVLKDSNVVDVTDALDHWGVKRLQTNVEEMIEDFAYYKPKFEALVADQSGVPTETVKLLPPIPRPSKILAAYSNYVDRVARSEPGPIEFFYKSPTGIIGPGDTVELPDNPEVGVYHFEAELAFVIGKTAKHVNESNAMDYIFGYIPFFDVSARPAPGIQRPTQFIGKGEDRFAPIGPYIVTADEVPDPHNLRVQSWVNGEERQDYTTGDMANNIPAQIAWLTQFVTLIPGDIVTTGTHHAGLRAINGGDKVEIEIENLGRMALEVKGFGPPKNTEPAIFARREESEQ